jgi:hypothetical protein
MYLSYVEMYILSKSQYSIEFKLLELNFYTIEVFLMFYNLFTYVTLNEI